MKRCRTARDPSHSLIQSAGIGRERTMKNFLTALWSDESGQDLAEYALLLVLIAVVVAVAVIAFRDAIVDGFNRATGELSDALAEGG
jgi:pilus assembly protein Flp/PilA